MTVSGTVRSAPTRAPQCVQLRHCEQRTALTHMNAGCEAQCPQQPRNLTKFSNAAHVTPATAYCKMLWCHTARQPSQRWAGLISNGRWAVWNRTFGACERGVSLFVPHSGAVPTWGVTLSAHFSSHFAAHFSVTFRCFYS